MAVEIVRSQPEHLQAMEIRPEDKAEFWAAAKVDPKDALRASLGDAWACLVDGEPVAVFGVTPPALLGGAAMPWLVGSVNLNPRLLVKPARAILAGWDYERLENWVDARNTKAIRWLRWLGFTIHPAEPYGVMGLPFHRFERRMPCATRL